MIGDAPRPQAMQAFTVFLALMLASAAFAQAPRRPAPAQAPAPAAPAPAAPVPAPADAVPLPPNSEIDGQPFRVSRMRLKYVKPGPNLPSVASLMSASIELGQLTDDKGNAFYVVPASLERRWLALPKFGPKPPQPRGPITRRLRLSESDDAVAVYYQSALWAIGQQIAEELNKRNILGVYVLPSPQQIQQLTSGYEDMRQGDTSLEFWIYTGRVADVRSFASGDRVPVKERKNSDKHKWIRDHSPVQPAPKAEAKAGAKAGTGAPAPGVDLLRRDLLDEYIFRLNRHPGRHVDVAVSAASTDPSGAGQVNLDYLITETRPWSVYFQLSNTGTRATSEWRERFGYLSNQFTGHDDSFSIDYTTAGFSDSHDVNVSYDFPVSDSRKLRVRAFGNFNQFTASDVGQAGLSFDGRTYGGGAEASYNVFQRRDNFIDLVAGARYEHNSVDNGGAGGTGTADFVVPYGGLRYEQIRDVSSLQADLMLVGRFSNAGEEDLNTLGRLNADSDAVLIQADASHSFFLEPIFRAKKFREAKSTLANEMVFSARAQYSLNRLIPAAEEVAGGLYSVRGYPESISAGDTVLIGSAEYRFHLPRILPTPKNPDRTYRFFGQPFRWQPQQTYARPDWDLVLRGFVDVGRTVNVDRESFEHNQTLVGTGLGVQLDIRQNLSVRLDGGVALNGVPDEVDRGDTRLHFVLTLLY